MYGGSLDSLRIWFCYDNLPPHDLGPFDNTLHMLDMLDSFFHDVHIFDI